MAGKSTKVKRQDAKSKKSAAKGPVGRKGAGAKSAKKTPVVPSSKQRATARAKANKKPQRKTVEAEVIKIFRECYPGEETRAEILAIDPNDFDTDPGTFYEMLEARFGVDQDPDNEYFGGYGGTVEDTIAFLTAGWDGKLYELTM